MANSNLIITLGKVIIAAAWADGEISTDEVNSLKDLLFHLPDLNARQWAELDMYIDYPVGPAERARLVDDLQNRISSERDRQLAIGALEEVVGADGAITDSEKQVLNEIKTAIENADVGVVNALSRLIKGPVSRRSEAARNAPNREKYMAHFMNNKVYFDVRRRLDMGETEINLPEAQLRKLSMAGGLMGQVARSDKTVTDEELSTIVDLLQQDWAVDKDQAAFVASIAVADTTEQIDRYRTAREFVDVCTHDELAAFVAMLFHIAAADGMVTRDEIEEIRNISRSLLLSHEQFIEAKLTVPRDQRAD